MSTGERTWWSTWRSAYLITHRSHLFVEDIGTLQDLIIFPAAQTCWVLRWFFNSTFGGRWRTKRHGTWRRKTWRHLHGIEARSDERRRGYAWGEGRRRHAYGTSKYRRLERTHANHWLLHWRNLCKGGTCSSHR